TLNRRVSVCCFALSGSRFARLLVSADTQTQEQMSVRPTPQRMSETLSAKRRHLLKTLALGMARTGSALTVASISILIVVLARAGRKWRPCVYWRRGEDVPPCQAPLMSPMLSSEVFFL